MANTYFMAESRKRPLLGTRKMAKQTDKETPAQYKKYV